MSGEAFYVWDLAGEQVAPKYEDLLPAFRRALAREDVPPMDKMLVLARLLPQVVRDNPDIDADVADFFGRVESWALSNYYGALRLELPADPFWIAKRILVKVASEVGVVLFDDLQGVFFLPDGRILPEAQGKKWQGAIHYLEGQHDFPTTVPQFKKLAFPLLEAILIRRGYVVDEVLQRENGGYNFSRQVECGVQMVGFKFERSYQGFTIPLSIQMSVDVVNDILSKFSFSNYDYLYIFELYDSFKEKLGDALYVSDVESLNELLSAIESYVLSIHESTKNIMGLNDLVEGRLGETLSRRILGVWTAPKALITLRLAGNKDFDRFAIEIPSNVRVWGRIGKAQGLAEWPKLVEYLKTHFDDDGKPIEQSGT